MLHGDRVQAAAESYIGLVEVGVGLIPAGGGTKEMLLRLGPQKAFETIGFAQDVDVGTRCVRLGYLRDGRRLDDESRSAGVRCKTGSAERVRRADIGRPSAPDGYSCRRRCRSRDARSWRASRVARRPDLRPRRDHRPQAVVDPCRAAPCLTPGKSAKINCWISSGRRFSACAASAKTLERIQYTLKTGKTLRN